MRDGRFFDSEKVPYAPTPSRCHPNSLKTHHGMHPFGILALEPSTYSSTVSFEALTPGWRIAPATMVGLMQTRSKRRGAARIHSQAEASCLQRECVNSCTCAQPFACTPHLPRGLHCVTAGDVRCRARHTLLTWSCRCCTTSRVSSAPRRRSTSTHRRHGLVQRGA